MYDQPDVVELGRNLAPYYYYAFIVRGVVLIGFGICFLFFPVASWVSFSFVFGSLALADAVFNISKACSYPGVFRGRRKQVSSHDHVPPQCVMYGSNR